MQADPVRPPSSRHCGSCGLERFLVKWKRSAGADFRQDKGDWRRAYPKVRSSRSPLSWRKDARPSGLVETGHLPARTAWPYAKAAPRALRTSSRSRLNQQNCFHSTRKHSKRRTPSSASNRRTASLIPEGLLLAIRAASRKPPARATATKILGSSRLIFIVRDPAQSVLTVPHYLELRQQLSCR